MSNFTNRVGGVNISTPSIQQPPSINPIAGGIQSLTSLAGSFSDALREPQKSQAQVTEELKTSGIQWANDIRLRSEEIVDQEERRRFVNRSFKDAAGVLGATELEAARGEFKVWYGDTTLEREAEDNLRTREAAEFELETKQITIGRQMLIAQGADPELVTEELALYFGLRQDAKLASLSWRGTELGVMQQERTEADAVRSVGSEIALEGYLFDVDTQIQTLISASSTKLSDPSTRIQTLTQMITKLDRLEASLELEATSAVRSAGGRMSDVQVGRLDAVRKRIQFYRSVLDGSSESKTIESLVTNMGFQHIINNMEDNPKFAGTVMIGAASKGWLSSPTVMSAANTNTSRFNWRDPREVLKLADNIRDGNPPTDPAKAQAFWGVLGPGFQIMAGSRKPDTETLTLGAESIVNALDQATNGKRTVVEASHKGDALRVLHRDLARLEGPALLEVQAAVNEEFDRQGIDPLELAIQDAAVTFREKVLPALRTWEYASGRRGTFLTNTEISATGGKFKLTFNPVVNEQRQQASSRRGGFGTMVSTARDANMGRDAKMIEAVFNDMVLSYHKLTGRSKEEIAEGMVSNIQFMMELEKQKGQ